MMIKLKEFIHYDRNELSRMYDEEDPLETVE